MQCLQFFIETQLKLTWKLYGNVKLFEQFHNSNYEEVLLLVILMWYCQLIWKLLTDGVVRKEWYCEELEDCNKFSRTLGCTMLAIFLSLLNKEISPKRIYNLDIATQRHRMSLKRINIRSKAYKQGILIARGEMDAIL